MVVLGEYPMSNALSNYFNKVTRGEKFPVLGDMAQWQKVKELKAGTQILVTGYGVEGSTEKDVFWDEIVSIQKVGREKVYDIEVEGTHNFIGNGIVAHNTYLNGNLGIGTTAASYPLDVRLGSDGDVAGFTDTNGTCTINPTSTALICTSDSTKKKNIETITNSLDMVDALRGVSFNWLGEDTGDQTHFGFVAQEVESILPSLVSTNARGIKSVNYLGFAPILANAIGEQQGQITMINDQLSMTNGELTTKVTAWDGLFISIQSIIQSIQDTIVALQTQLGLVQADISSTKDQVASLSASLNSMNVDYTSWKDAIASGSGVLGASDSALLDRVATVSSLLVQNKTTTFDLTVLNKLTSGVIELGAGISGDEINSSGGIRFQTLAQGPIDFMNGKVVIDVDGSVKAVKVHAEQYAVSKDQGAIGLGLIKAGEASVTIDAPNVNAGSRIFITALTKTNKPLYISEISAGSHFIVSLGETTLEDTRFNWWVVEEE